MNYRYTCCIAATSTGVFSIDLSNISGQSLNLFTGATRSISFTANSTLNSDLCGITCSYVEYRVSVTGGSNTALITLPDSQTKSITFASSNSLSDAGSYNIALQAKYHEDYVWSPATTATFFYSNPCSSTTLSAA